MQLSKATVTGGFLTLLVALGAVDVAIQNPLPTSVGASQSSQSSSAQTSSQPSEELGDAPDMVALLLEYGFQFEQTSESVFLTQVIPASDATVHGTALLKDGDRAGAIAWAETPNVKTHFATLKEALHSSFSSDVRDLVDETRRPADHPPSNLLTFFDPAINEERLAFLRIGHRLYEVHMAAAHEDELFQLIDRLAQ